MDTVQDLSVIIKQSNAIMIQLQQQIHFVNKRHA